MMLDVVECVMMIVLSYTGWLVTMTSRLVLACWLASASKCCWCGCDTTKSCSGSSSSGSSGGS